MTDGLADFSQVSAVGSSSGGSDGPYTASIYTMPPLLWSSIAPPITFIEPNPSEAARGSKFRYASHNLRFKINRAGEDEATFKARISKLAEPTGTPANDEEDMWDFGSNRRDVGSLHIDQLSCKASDLARRSFVAVHPVTGWWKTKSRLQGELPSVRYALIVEIDAEDLAADIRTEVETAIAAMVAAQVVTKV